MHIKNTLYELGVWSDTQILERWQDILTELRGPLYPSEMAERLSNEIIETGRVDIANQMARILVEDLQAYAEEVCEGIEVTYFINGSMDTYICINSVYVQTLTQLEIALENYKESNYMTIRELLDGCDLVLDEEGIAYKFELEEGNDQLDLHNGVDLACIVDLTDRVPDGDTITVSTSWGTKTFTRYKKRS